MEDSLRIFVRIRNVIFNTVKFIMLGFLFKIVRYIEKEENIIYKEEKS